MQRHGLTLVFSLLMVSISTSAQPTGTIMGSVLLDNGSPAAGAPVRLDNYLLPFHAVQQTGADGSYSWSGLEEGDYYFTAMLMEHGFAFDSRAVTASDTTTLTLFLQPARGDTLTEAYFHGTTIVEPANQEHALPWYFVDVNDDQVGDFRLSFGPSWYDPPYVDRPLNGTEISVTGGMFSYAAEPMLIVYDLADSIWRNPGIGHGGFGGTQGFFSLVCHTLDTSGTGGLANPTRIEIAGTPMYDLCWPPDTLTPPGVYEFADTSGNFSSYHVNFGHDPTYFCSPTGWYFIVGGLVEVPNDEMPWVIPYEVNGEFWREPGDTTGLAPMGGSAAHDPLIPHPSSLVLSAHPNPFNAVTTLSFTLPQASSVTLRIFDLLGQEVDRIDRGRMGAGEHTLIYSAEHLSSGLYFARLETMSNSVTQKLVILK